MEKVQLRFEKLLHKTIIETNKEENVKNIKYLEIAKIDYSELSLKYFDKALSDLILSEK